MHYTATIDIDAPPKKVAELFIDTRRFGEWVEGFERCESIDGEFGQTGSRARVSTHDGKKSHETAETVEENRLPESITIGYDTKGAHSRAVHRFFEVMPGLTRWTAELETHFAGTSNVQALRPFHSKHETQKEMARFKDFVEHQG